MRIHARKVETASRGSKTVCIVRVLFLICLVLIPSLYLGLLTLIALWIGAMQLSLLRPGQAPDSQFLVLGSAGAAGLVGFWILVLIPPERLRSSNLLRIAATAASTVGIALAIIFLSGEACMAGILVLARAR